MLWVGRLKGSPGSSGLTCADCVARQTKKALAKAKEEREAAARRARAEAERIAREEASMSATELKLKQQQRIEQADAAHMDDLFGDTVTPLSECGAACGGDGWSCTRWDQTRVCWERCWFCRVLGAHGTSHPLVSTNVPCDCLSVCGDCLTCCLPTYAVTASLRTL